MKPLLCLLTGVALTLAACDLVTSDPPADAGGDAASKAPVPILIRAKAQVASDAVAIPCLLPNGTPVDFEAPSHWTSQGNASHLGKIESSITVEECVLDPDHGMVMAGPAIHVGAEGSTLSVYYKMALVPTADPVVFDLDFFDVRFTCGTGKMGCVSGSGSGSGTASLATGSGWYQIRGHITRP